MNKLIRAVKRGWSIESVRNYCAWKLATGKCRVISDMNYIPDDRKIMISHTDFVRTGALELMAYEINDKNIEGSAAELGVYQGSFASCINRVFANRKLFLFDTFAGFDKKDTEKDVKEGYSLGMQDFSDTGVEMVLERMPHPELCIIKKGWFPDTAKGLENEHFVFVSIDADLYEPIYEGLNFFYPRLQKGGGGICP